MLTQDEILKIQEEWDAKITPQTMRNREKIGITSPAYRGGAGRPGRSVFYPDRVLWENYAATKMMNSKKLRLTAQEVKAAKDFACKSEVDPDWPYVLYSGPEEEMLPVRFANIWHALIVHAWLRIPSSVVALVCFGGSDFEPGSDFVESLMKNATVFGGQMHSYYLVKNPPVDGHLLVHVSKDRRFTLLNNDPNTKYDWQLSEDVVNLGTLL